MAMKPQIKNTKTDSNYTFLTVPSLVSALQKDENYDPQLFLKELKHIRKRVIRHINHNSSGLYSFDESYDSDKEKIF